ncbi:MAG: PDZ domain-containing protein [Planctomycetaceae bacterium]
MRSIFRVSLVLALIALIVAAITPAAQSADVPLEGLEEQAFREAAALVAPSVVRVQTVGGLDRVGEVLTGTGPTTGVVVSSDGFIISSAFNFASKPSSILVQLADGRRLPATQVATDRARMLTLLKVETDGLVPVQVSGDSPVRVGQWAIALGRTYEVEQPSVSVGIVSALNRIWGKAIQTDAKVSPVNYGGPLVDIEGRTLGILVPLSVGENEETAGVEWYDSGIGFAVPMKDVLAAVERLKAGKDLHPGLMGITFKPGLLDAAPQIDRVRFGSPAAEAGLKPGDLIVEADGKPVARPDDVKQVIGRKYAGESVAIAVKRGEETVKRDITLVAELKAYESGFLGILPAREPLAGEKTPGVGIRYLYPESPAAKAGLQKGDRIIRFANTAVAGPQALTDLVGRLRPEEKAPLVYVRDGKETSVEATLSAIPNAIPADLPSFAIEPPEALPAGQKPPQTGRFTVTMPNHEHSYWAYVPDDYNRNYRYTVMVWIHPEGDTMEAAVLNRWKAICEQRGIIIVAPKADKISGWEPNEAEFAKDALDEVAKNYSVDSSRVFLHSFSSGGGFASYLAFRYRDRVRGLAMAAAPLRMRPPENDPDHRLQFHLVVGDQDDVAKAVEETAKALQKLKFPASFTRVNDLDHQYPAAEIVEEIGRWADSLDRI